MLFRSYGNQWAIKEAGVRSKQSQAVSSSSSLLPSGHTVTPLIWRQKKTYKASLYGFLLEKHLDVFALKLNRSETAWIMRYVLDL